MTFRSALSVCLGLALSMALLGLPPPATATVLTEINGLIMNDASANADVTLV